MADGRVVIEAVLDTVNVTKNVKKLNQDLKGITWNDISKGTDKAKTLGNSFKAAGAACTAKLTVPIAAAAPRRSRWPPTTSRPPRASRRRSG